MENKKYKVVIAQSGKLDVKEKKKYILQQFKYREYAENFSKKIKKAVLALDTLPTGYNTTGFRYRGYDIYMKPCESYLLFYTVDEAVKTVTVLRVIHFIHIKSYAIVFYNNIYRIFRSFSDCYPDSAFCSLWLQSMDDRILYYRFYTESGDITFLYLIRLPFNIIGDDILKSFTLKV